MSIKKSLKNATAITVRSVLNCLSQFVKIRRNRILFYSYSGDQYSCSPRYLSEYISRHEPEKFEIIWAFRAPEKFRHILSNGKTEKNTKPIKIVRYNSLRFFYYYASAGFIVNNIYPSLFLHTKKGQCMIDTWHGGGAYKCAVTEQNLKATHSYRKELDYFSDNISVFLSSSKKFSECFIKGDMHYQGRILDTGLIRNDLFFADADTKRRIREKVQKKLGMDLDEKILMYAPTWRQKNTKGIHELFQIDQLRNALTERFGGTWSIVFRMHRLSQEELVDGTVDASAYPDMQELLIAADFLITDYSSCIWDYSLMRKPLLLYAYDLEKYTANQGFYDDIHTWGVPVCEVFEDILHMIGSVSDSEYIHNAEAHDQQFGGYDRGHAAERTTAFILQNLE